MPFLSYLATDIWKSGDFQLEVPGKITILAFTWTCVRTATDQAQRILNEDGAITFVESGRASASSLLALRTLVANGYLRLSIPRAGRTVGSSAEERAVFVREAVEIIAEAISGQDIEADFDTVYSTRWQVDETGAQHDPIVLRAAWALINVWLAGSLSGALSNLASISEAEDWFYGQDKELLPSLANRLSARTRFSLIRPLGRLKVDADLLDLLPYILEPHGPGSRLSVMKDPGTLDAWNAKRDDGVFYTPSDVADYMVATAADDLRPDLGPFLVLDPACGTGVYLVAMLRHAVATQGVDPLSYAIAHLYGIDVSDRSVESCAFVLLNYCLKSVSTGGHSPWSAWQALRLNLAAADSLKLRIDRDSDNADNCQRREKMRTRFLQKGRDRAKLLGYEPQAGTRRINLFGWEAEKHSSIELGHLFPEMSRGCDLLVGNPPYAELGERDDFKHLVEEYATLKHSQPGGNENIYLLFVEMMWRLTKRGHSAASLVVPLSIAYHQGKDYSACRQAMATKGGTWRCAFFDREPHALFGEDVKTRNAILFRREAIAELGHGLKAKIETGPLRKWTSRTRDGLFNSIRFTPIASSNIVRGIPKLEGPELSKVFTVLVSRQDSLTTLYKKARSLRQCAAFVPCESPRVFIASTAYNFLNVYRPLSDEESGLPGSENSVHCLEFARVDTANLAFAVLCSRLVYGLWHAQGDGFHVARWFIESIPFGVSSFTEAQSASLQGLGRELWDELQKHRIVSVNRGKQTIAFRPLACDRERDEIDTILLKAADLPTSMLDVLRSFIVSTVFVDHTDASRQHLISHFQRIETVPCPTERTSTPARRASSPRKNGGNTRRQSGI